MTARTPALTVLLAAFLVLAGCSADDDGDAPGQTESPGPSPTATSPSPAATSPSPVATSPGEPTATPTTPGPDGDEAAELPALAATCDLPTPDTAPADRGTIAYPEGWRVGDGCEWFDPAADTVAAQTEPDVAVSWRAEAVPFAEAADLEREVDDQVRYVGAKAGYQAVRVEGVATGEGLRSEGERVLTWMVDLDPGADDDGGTLIGSARTSDGASFDLAAAALDRMAGTLLVEPPAAGIDEPIVVTRVEGGGQPYAVTWDHQCFRLHAGAPDGPVQDESCEVGSPDDGLATVLLEPDDGLAVLAGLTDPRAERVTVPAASGMFGAFVTSLEGGGAFAMHVRQPPFEVTAVDLAGETVATERVGG